MFIEGPECSDSKRASYSTEQHSNIFAKDVPNHMGIEEVMLKNELHNDRHKYRFPSLLHQSLMLTSPCYYKCSNYINTIPTIKTYAGSTWETNSSSAESFEASSRSFSLLNNDINYVSNSSSEKIDLDGLNDLFANSCSCDDTQSIIDESLNSIFFDDYDSDGSDTLFFSDEENNSDEADSRNDSETKRYTQYGNQGTEGDASARTDAGASTVSRRRKEWKVIYKKREKELDNGLRAIVGHVVHSKQPKGKAHALRQVLEVLHRNYPLPHSNHYYSYPHQVAEAMIISLSILISRPYRSHLHPRSLKEINMIASSMLVGTN